VVFPGWQLSGVAPDSGSNLLGRVVVAGSGPGLAAPAIGLHHRGGDGRAVFEATSAPWDSDSAAYLRKAGVVLRNRHLLIRAEGDERVERAVVARVDAEWRVRPGSESAFEVNSLVL